MPDAVMLAFEATPADMQATKGIIVPAVAAAIATAVESVAIDTTAPAD